MNMRFETPVILIVFNRPDHTRKLFEVIASIRPKRLLLIADGPRIDRHGEDALCAQTRSIVSSVNWPCDVSSNFSKENLGCNTRIVSGLEWAFTLVDEAIVLEDDCI